MSIDKFALLIPFFRCANNAKWREICHIAKIYRRVNVKKIVEPWKRLPTWFNSYNVLCSSDRASSMDLFDQITLYFPFDKREMSFSGWLYVVIYFIRLNMNSAGCRAKPIVHLDFQVVLGNSMKSETIIEPVSHIEIGWYDIFYHSFCFSSWNWWKRFVRVNWDSSEFCDRFRFFQSLWLKYENIKQSIWSNWAEPLLAQKHTIRYNQIV